MDKIAIYPFLGEQKIPYEKIEHPAVFNMEQLASIHLPHRNGTPRTSSSGTTRSAITI